MLRVDAFISTTFKRPDGTFASGNYPLGGIQRVDVFLTQGVDRPRIRFTGDWKSLMELTRVTDQMKRDDAVGATFMNGRICKRVFIHTHEGKETHRQFTAFGPWRSSDIELKKI